MKTPVFARAGIFPAMVFMATSGFAVDLDGYLAAVGVGSEGSRYLKVARITEMATSPAVAQVQSDISGDFTSLQDVAFLRGPDSNRVVAVLGNARDFVPNEQYIDWRWRGFTHRLRGKVVLYDVNPTGTPVTVSVLKTIVFDHPVTASLITVSSEHMAFQHFETWRLAGLPGGGFVVNVSDVRDYWQNGHPDNLHPFNWAILFDRTHTLRFHAGIAAGFIGSSGAVDAAGFVNPDKDVFAAIWQGVSGTPCGTLRRYRVNWAAGTLSEEALLNGVQGWIYYMNNVAPLAYLGPEPALSGGVVVREGQNACNASGGFASGVFDAAKGWGRIAAVPGGLEVMGLNSDGANVMVAFRSGGGTNRLYRVGVDTGTYVDTGFAFAWGGDPWTVTASDGDAMAYSVVAPRLRLLPQADHEQLEWESEWGQWYQVMATMDLAHPDWQPVGGEITGTGTNLTVDVSFPDDAPRAVRIDTRRK